MEKRILIAGSRHYKNYNEAKMFIDNCISNIRKNNAIIILSGGCRGTDFLGEHYAIENNFKTEIYFAEWDKYGYSAGPIRNEKMIQRCDYVICFWDKKSRGTYSVINLAKKYNKPIRIKFITPNIQ